MITALLMFGISIYTKRRNTIILLELNLPLMKTWPDLRKCIHLIGKTSEILAPSACYSNGRKDRIIHLISLSFHACNDKQKKKNLKQLQLLQC